MLAMMRSPFLPWSIDNVHIYNSSSKYEYQITDMQNCHFRIIRKDFDLTSSLIFNINMYRERKNSVLTFSLLFFRDLELLVLLDRLEGELGQGVDGVQRAAGLRL